MAKHKIGDKELSTWGDFRIDDREFTDFDGMDFIFDYFLIDFKMIKTRHLC